MSNGTPDKGSTPELATGRAQDMIPSINFDTGTVGEARGALRMAPSVRTRQADITPEYDFPHRFDSNQALLDSRRAQLQSYGEKFWNMAAQSRAKLGYGIIEGVGLLLDIPEQVNAAITGKEAEFGNWISNWAAEKRDKILEDRPIYARKPGKYDPSDPSWWMQGIPDVVGSLSMLIPAGAFARGTMWAAKAVKTAQLAKQAGKVVKAASTFNKSGKAVNIMKRLGTEGALTGLYSRMIESSMEGGEAWETKYQSVLDGGGTEEDARQQAGVAAARTYRADMSLVLIDMAQHASIYGALSNKMGSVVRDIAKEGTKTAKVLTAGKALSTTALQVGSEGVEEGFQMLNMLEATEASDRFWNGNTYNRLKYDYWHRDEFATTVAYGAMGGGVFSMAGPLTARGIKGGANAASKYFNNRAINKHQANLQGDPSLIKSISDSEYIKVLRSHAKRDRVEEILPILEGLQQTTDEEITQMGYDPKEYKEALAKKIEDTKWASSMWNKVKNSFDDKNVATEVFSAYVASKLNTELEVDVEAELAQIEQDFGFPVSDPSTYAHAALKVLSKFDDTAPEVVAAVEKRTAELEEQLGNEKLKHAYPPGLLELVRRKEFTNINRTVIDTSIAYLSTIEGQEEAKKEGKLEDHRAEKEVNEAVKEIKSNATKEMAKSNAENHQKHAYSTGNDPKTTDTLNTQESTDSSIDPETKEQEATAENIPFLKPGDRISFNGQPVTILEMTESGVARMEYADGSQSGMEPLTPGNTKFIKGPITPTVPTDIKVSNEIWEHFEETKTVPEETLKEIALDEYHGSPPSARQSAIIAAMPEQYKEIRDVLFGEYKNKIEEIPTLEDTEQYSEDTNAQVEKKGIALWDEYQREEEGISKRQQVVDHSRTHGGSTKIAYLPIKPEKQKFKALGIVGYYNSKEINVSNEGVYAESQIPGVTNVGDDVTLEVYDIDSQDVPTGEDRGVERWGDAKKSMSQEQWDSHVPIIITNSKGQKLGYLHDASWITSDNVRGDVQADLDNLMRLRRAVIRQGDPITTKITSVSSGRLIKHADGYHKVSIRAPKARLAVFNQLGGMQGLTLNEKENLILGSNTEWSNGKTYLIIPTTNRKFIALPLKAAIISADLALSGKEATRMFIGGKGSTLSPFGQAVWSKMKLDLRDRKDYKKYMDRFVFDKDVPKSHDAYDKEDHNSALGEFADVQKSTYVGFTIEGNGVSWARGFGKGIRDRQGRSDRNLNQNIKNTAAIEEMLNELEAHFQKMYFNTNLDNVLNDTDSGTGIVIYKDGKISSTEGGYHDFVKDNTMTDVQHVDVGGTSIYTTQAVFRFDDSFAQEFVDKTLRKKVTLENGVPTVWGASQEVGNINGWVIDSNQSHSRNDEVKRRAAIEMPDSFGSLAKTTTEVKKNKKEAEEQTEKEIAKTQQATQGELFSKTDEEITAEDVVAEQDAEKPTTPFLEVGQFKSRIKINPKTGSVRVISSLAALKASAPQDPDSYIDVNPDTTAADVKDGTVTVKIVKDARSKWTLKVDNSGNVFNANTGKRITDEKLINKAMLRSEKLKYAKVVGPNGKNYAVTPDLRVINIHKGKSAGNELTKGSSIYNGVIKKYNELTQEVEQPKKQTKKETPPLKSDPANQLTKEEMEDLFDEEEDPDDPDSSWFPKPAENELVSKEDIQEAIAKSLNAEILVEGFSTREQNQLKASLASAVLEAVMLQQEEAPGFSGKEVYRVTSNAIQEYKVTLENYRDTLQNSLIPQARQSKKGRKVLPVYEKALNRLNFLLKKEGEETPNWKLFVNLTARFLARRGTSIQVGLAKMVDAANNPESNPMGRFKELSDFLVNPKETSSKKVKQFLSFIPKKNGSGVQRPTFLGRHLQKKYPTIFRAYENFDPIFYRLMHNLTETDASFSSVIARLEEVIKTTETDASAGTNQWRKTVIKRLKETPKDVQNKFIYDMRRDYTALKTILIDTGDNAYSIRMINEDSSDATVYVVEEWKDTFKGKSNRNTIYDRDAWKITPAAATRLRKKISDWRDRYQNNEAFREEILPGMRDFFMELGIDLHNDVLTQIVKGRPGKTSKENTGLFYNGHTYTLKDFLFNEGSFIKYVYEQLGGIVKHPKDVNDVKLHASGMLTKMAYHHADAEAKRTLSSTKVNGKTISALNAPKFLSSQIRRLKEATRTEAQNMMRSAYNRHASWLQYLTPINKDVVGDDTKKEAFSQIFTTDQMSIRPVKKIREAVIRDKELTDLNMVDIELTRLLAFTSKVIKSKTLKKRITHIPYSTTSDKANIRLVQSVIEDIELDAAGGITQKNTDFIIKHMVMSEVERIIDAQDKQSRYTGYDKGSQFFYTFPLLNDPDNGLWGADHKLLPDVLTGLLAKLTTGVSLDASSDRIYTIISNVVEDHINSLISDKISTWSDMGVIDQYGNIIVDKEYRAEHSGNSTKETNRNIAADYVVNNLIAQHNFSALFWGDPAIYYTVENNKKLDSYKKQDFLDDVKSTFLNVGKRLAGDVAPGKEPVHNGDTQYTQGYLKDREVISKSLNFYKKIFGSNSKQIEKYSKINSADAQEFVTIDEHMKVLFMMGDIPEKLFNDFNAFRAEDKDADVPTELLPKAIQVMKPVYVGNHFEDGVMQRTYIKSAAFALLPQYTKGTELDNLRKAMDQQTIDRVGFASAVKVGGLKDATQFFKTVDGKQTHETIPGTVIETNTLDRRNFRIQQEIPTKGIGGSITVGSQLRRLQFVDLLGFPGMQDLHDEFVDTYGALWHSQYKALLKSISFNEETGDYNHAVLMELAKDEAIARDYTINDILGIELAKDPRNVKLWSLPSYKRIESLLISIVDNNIRKMKVPGQELALVSEAGFSLSGTPSQKGVLFTEAWDGESLKHTRYANKKVKASQILVPWPFKDVDINAFKDPKTGRIVIPESIRHAIGYRIPTQSNGSAIRIEIAGFLPEGYTDTVVASEDLIIQMGSDFDFDKLRVNYKQVFYDKETNTLSERGTKDEDGDLVETNVNQLMNIQLEVMANPNKQVQAIFAKALDIEILRDAAEGVYDAKAVKKDVVDADNNFSPFSDQYQASKYYSGSQGQKGISVFAKTTTLHGLAQSAGRPPIRATKIKLQFGDFVSDGTLGKTLSADGDNRISQHISEFLSAAVDNEKEQLLGEINVNNDTIGIVSTLLVLGFPPKVIVPFINQQVIYDLNNQSDRLQQLKNFPPAKARREAWKTVKDELTRREGVDAAMVLPYPEAREKVVPTKYINFSPEDMHLSLAGLLNPVEEALYQLGVLENLGNILKTSSDLTNLHNSISVDSAGLGKNLFEAISAHETLMDLRHVDFESISNANRFVGEFFLHDTKTDTTYAQDASDEVHYSTDLPEDAVKIGREKVHIYTGDGSIESSFYADVYLFPSTIAGHAAAYTHSSVQKTYLSKVGNNAMFPYESPVFKSLFQHVNNLTDIKWLKGKFLVSAKEDFFEHVKSFLSLKPQMKLVGTRLRAERSRLFRDVPGSPSLGTRLRSISMDPAFKNHDFLKFITVYEADGLIKLKFNAAHDQDMDHETIYAAFQSMFVDNVRFKNGEHINDVALDLAIAAYISGGQQKAREYTQIIPIEFLNRIGFLQGFANIDWQGGMDFGGAPANDLDINPMVRQYIQHKPFLAEDYTYRKRKTSDISKGFIERPDSVDKGGLVYPPTFVRITRDSETQLYQYDRTNQKYYPISTLGAFGFIEYDPYHGSTGAYSMIQGQNSPVAPRVQFESLSPYDVTEEVPLPYTRETVFATTKELDSYGLTPGQESASKALSSIANSDSPLAKVAATMGVLIDEGKLPLTFLRDDNLVDKDGDMRAGRMTLKKSGRAEVTINVKAASNLIELQTMIIHEIGHAATRIYVRDYARWKNKQPNNLDKSLIPVLKRLDGAFQLFQKRVEAGDIEIPEHFKAATQNLDEFIARTLDSPDMQEFLNTTMWQGNKNWWNNIASKLARFFSELALSFGINLGDQVKKDIYELMRAPGKAETLSKGLEPSHKIPFTPEEELSLISGDKTLHVSSITPFTGNALSVGEIGVIKVQEHYFSIENLGKKGAAEMGGQKDAALQLGLVGKVMSDLNEETKKWLTTKTNYNTYRIRPIRQPSPNAELISSSEAGLAMQDMLVEGKSVKYPLDDKQSAQRAQEAYEAQYPGRTTTLRELPDGWVFQVTPIEFQFEDESFFPARKPKAKLSPEEGRRVIEKARRNKKVLDHEDNINRTETALRKSTTKKEQKKYRELLQRQYIRRQELITELTVVSDLEKIEDYKAFFESRLKAIKDYLQLGISGGDMILHKQELIFLRDLMHAKSDESHSFYLSDEKTNPAVKDLFYSIGSEAQTFLDDLNNRIKKVGLTTSETLLGETLNTDVVSENFLTETDKLAGQIYTMRFDQEPIVQAITNLLGATVVAAFNISDKIVKPIERTIKNIEKKYGNKVYDQFWQKVEGRKTNYIVHPYAFDYTQMHTKAIDKYDFTKANYTYAGRLAGTKALNENSLLLNPTLLFEDPSSPEAQAHRAEVISHAGDYAGNKAIEKAKDLYEDYLLQEEVSKGWMEEKQFNDWKLENDPRETARAWKSSPRDHSLVGRIRAKVLVNGMHSVTVPLRYRGAKKTATGHYDSDFSEIAKDPELLRFHEALIEFSGALYSGLPRKYQRNFLAENAMMALPKDFYDNLRQHYADLKSGKIDQNKFQELVRDYYVDRTKVGSQGTVSNIDQETGESTYEVLPHIQGVEKAVSNEEFFILQNVQNKITEADRTTINQVAIDLGIDKTGDYLKYKSGDITLKKFKSRLSGNALSSDFYRELNLQARDAVSRENNTDLGKTLMVGTYLLESYKQKTLANGQLDVLYDILESKEAFLRNPETGDLLRDAAGKAIPAPGLAEKVKRADSTRKGFAGYATDEEVFSSSNEINILNTKDKRRRAIMDEAWERDDLTEAQEDELIKMEESVEIGNRSSVDAKLEWANRQIHRIGLGFNISANIRNLIEGQSANMSEAAAMGDLIGYKRFANTFITRGLYTNDKGKLVGGSEAARSMKVLMDSNNLAVDSTSEILKKAGKSGRDKVYKFFQLYAGTKYVEMRNQAPLAGWLLTRVKISDLNSDYKGKESVWEAVKETGEWNESKFGPLPQDNWFLLMNDIKGMIGRIHGEYDSTFRTRAKDNVIGRMFMSFFSWAPAKLDYSFGSKQQFRGRFIKSTRRGYVRSVSQAFLGNTSMSKLFYKDQKTIFNEDYKGSKAGLETLRYMFISLGRKWLRMGNNFEERFTAHDAANMHRFLSLLNSFVMITMAKLLGKALSEADDEPIVAATGYMMYNMFSRSQEDLNFFLNPRALSKKAASGIPMFSTVGRVLNLSEDALTFIFDEDKTGGDVLQDAAQLVPYLNEPFRWYRTGTKVVKPYGG